MTDWLKEAKRIYDNHDADVYFCPRIMLCYGPEYISLFSMDDQGFQCLYRDEFILTLLFAKEMIKP